MFVKFEGGAAAMRNSLSLSTRDLKGLGEHNGRQSVFQTVDQDVVSIKPASDMEASSAVRTYLNTYKDYKVDKGDEETKEDDFRVDDGKYELLDDMLDLAKDSDNNNTTYEERDNADADHEYFETKLTALNGGVAETWTGGNPDVSTQANAVSAVTTLTTEKEEKAQDRGTELAEWTGSEAEYRMSEAMHKAAVLDRKRKEFDSGTYTKKTQISGFSVTLKAMSAQKGLFDTYA